MPLGEKLFRILKWTHGIKRVGLNTATPMQLSKMHAYLLTAGAAASVDTSGAIIFSALDRPNGPRFSDFNLIFPVKNKALT